MKRITLFLLTGLLAVLLTDGLAQAQNATIRGRIVGEDYLPLPGAQVYIPSLNKGSISDVNGQYRLANLPVGTYEVKVSYLGYQEINKTLSVNAAQTLLADFELKAGVDIEGVVVSAALQGQSRALNQQKTSPNITNVISSDQVGKFPDDNIGDALKRIPGISVQYDQGEARFGNIRGTAPQLSTVMINGERIPSAEAEIRSVQLDLVPSDMIQSIEVSKAVTPDMDADAIGGAINLVTRSAPFGRRISGTIGSGYNLIAEKPMLNGSFVIADRLAQGRLGVVLSASYHDHSLGSDNIEFEWDYEDENDNDKFDEGELVWPKEKQLRQYYLQRIRQSYSLSLDYVLNENHTLFVSGIYNHRNDWENRFRTVYDGISEDGSEVEEIVKETKAGVEENKFARLEDQRAMTFSLGGEHLFGKLSAKWSATYAKASEERPNERYLAFKAEEAQLDADFSNPEKPFVQVTDPELQQLSTAWELDELTEQYQYTEDVDMNARLDFSLPLAEGTYANHLKFGLRLRNKNKERDNWLKEYAPVDEDAFLQEMLSNTRDLNKDNFLPGEEYLVGDHSHQEWVGGLDLENEDRFEGELIPGEEAGDFTATENIIAGYAMIHQNLGKKLKVLAGIRLENTNLEYAGFSYDDEEEVLTPTGNVKSDYLNVLPGIHFKYTPVENLNVRLAWTNTLARPDYFSLVPYQEYDDEEISIGNPELVPTESMNLDFMVEKYFRSIGLISGGIFYKDLSNIIVTEVTEVASGTFEGYEQYKPVNAGDASLTGLEFAIQRQLDFLPGALRGLGVYANYTFTDSEVKNFKLGDRDDEDLSLPGSPKHSLNTSLSYDIKKLTVRFSLNYASDFIDELDEDPILDRYYDQVTYLDLNINYALSELLNIYFNGLNLTNQPLRYYQGISSRTMQAEYYNMRFTAGVKFNL